MMPEISSLSNEEGLYKCGIFSLEMRRLRSDLIIIITIMDILKCYFAMEHIALSF